MTSFKFKAMAVSALLAATGFTSPVSANVVDLFTDPPGGQEVKWSKAASDPLGTYFSQVGDFPLTILGGYRDVVLNVTNATGSAGNATASAFVGGGLFDLATSANVTASARVQWDGNDNSAALDVDGLNGADLVNQPGCPTSGCTQFIADVSFTDIAFEYQIVIYDMQGDFSILTSGAPGGITSSTPIDFPFEWWNLSNGDKFIDGVPFNIFRSGVVDFDNIGAVEFIVNSNGVAVSVDLQLGAVTKTGVPEPASIALAGLALLGLGAARRRKQ